MVARKVRKANNQNGILTGTAPGNRGKSFQIMIIDESGAKRHTMTRAELERLYKEIERFVADSTLDECYANEKAITGIETMIHQRMRSAD